MLASIPVPGEIGIPAAAGPGLAGRALLGWMDREQAVKFLMQDCLFSPTLTLAAAEEMWESYRAIVENLPPEAPPSVGKLAMSAADLKAARKFRNRYPGAAGIVDFVRLSPMDLIVHQLWISTDISSGYRDKVTPDKWHHTALLDPPSNPRLKSRSSGDEISFDLPHSEFFLSIPSQPNEIRVTEGDGFVTVAVHGDRALLLRGYHRTFACAQYVREAVNAPHGVLFAVSDQLKAIGSLANDTLKMMEGHRPPRLADFFDDRLSLPVTLRRRQYQMRVHCEVVEIDYQEGQSTDGRTTLAVTPEFAQPGYTERSTDSQRNFQQIFDEALREHMALRIDNAVALYQRALFLRPDSHDTHNNLGVALIAQGKADEAVRHCERALAINPNHVSAHTNLGIALTMQGKIDQATAQHQRALALNPAYAEAHVELGNILKYQGRFDEAAAEYAQAIAIRSDYAEAHFMRSEIKTFHRGDPDMPALEALAARDDLPAHRALIAHFTLHKAFEDCGDYPKAFEHLRKGSDLKRGLVQYHETRVSHFFHRLSEVFDRGIFDRLQGEGDPSSLPIFVVGMPRSGSTLIEQILASHPEVYGAGELRDFELAEHTVFRAGGQPIPYPDFVPTLDGAALRRMAQTYLARLPALADGKIRIVDKMPGNFMQVGLIRLVLPNARIIHSMRDPLDTCMSCYSKLFNLGQPFSYDLAELGRYYRLYAGTMAHWRSVLPPGSMLDVSYEDVVDDVEGQARRLIEYCGLPWDDRCVSFHKSGAPVRTASAAQVRQPLFRSSLQRWRKYEAHLGPLLRELGDLVPADVTGAAGSVEPQLELK
jgi:tetratricopeptide (TPR) repeat protein